MSYKVLITTSGLGSRLGDFTKNTNKALLRIGNLPVISRIIDVYPSNTDFVITLGYHGGHIKQFLKAAYPKHSFEFVEINPFEGEGSSLLYSMLSAKEYLQSPFFFHASDTLVPKFAKVLKDQNLSFNTIYGKKGFGSSMYASLNVKNNVVTKIYNKGELSPDFLHIGLIFIKDFHIFWESAKKILEKSPNDQTLGDVNVIRDIIESNLGTFRFFEIKNWIDTGSVQGLMDAKKFYESKDFKVLDKAEESIYFTNDKVIKFFTKANVCQNRIERAITLKDVVPPLTDKLENIYSYKFVEGELLTKRFDKNIISEILNWADSNLWISNPDNPNFENICKDFYVRKTEKRINEFLRLGYFKEEPEFINGLKISPINELINKIDFKNWICKTDNIRFHGDFILDNILVTSDNHFKLIDWRQDFGGDIYSGDKYYDLGKFAHNLVVNHDIIDQNLFSVDLSNTDRTAQFNLNRPFNLVEFEKEFYKWIQDKGLDYRKVKIIRSIIWLNMSPLHHHPFDLLLYLLGKYTLQIHLNDL